MSEQKQSSTPQTKAPRRRLDAWNKIAIGILTLFLVGCISVFFILVNVINDPEGMRFTKDGLSTLSNSRIFDDSGNMVYEIGSEIREDITYEQLPQDVIDAFLAVEDSRYFEHNGFDMPRFLMAAIENLKSGSFGQGGSTLTMQMIDNAFTKNQENKLEAEKGPLSKLDQIKLKIQEIYLSLIAEQTIDKEDIMEYYLNRIWFGSGGNTRGIQKAAKYYFNKDVSDLNLSEAAFLAGSINAPYAYNPLNNLNPDDQDVDYLANATKRRNTALYLMLQHGYITDEEYNLEKNTDLALALDYKETISTDPNQAYIDQVITETIQLTGQDPTIIPMDIYTALNQSAQAEMDKMMNGEIVPFPNDEFDVGSSITNNATGEIIAVAPGRHYHSDSVKQDNSINTKQPGSSMKPLLAYCSTFDLLGWSTTHVVDDRGDDYWHAGFNVQNSDRKYEGKISLKYALGVSKNTTAAATMVELVNTTGRDYWVEFCRKLGYDEEVCDMFAEQYCIGGADMYASPVQMASAYSMFANQGNRINAHRIRRIIRRSDNEEIAGNSTEYSLISTQAAFMMSDLLQNVVYGGYNNYNNILGSTDYVAYAKSGTSNWGPEGAQYGIPDGVPKDEWSIGYTSTYTIATWSGYLPQDYSKGLYVDDYVLSTAYAFHFNRHMLDFLAPGGNYHPIERPDGVSDYNGGYIKTDFLAQGDATSGVSQNPSPSQDDVTPQEKSEEQTACEGSGGSFDNGACSCPNGMELNGTACQPVTNPDDSDQNQTQQPETPVETPVVPDTPQQPENPENPDPGTTNPPEGGDDGSEPDPIPDTPQAAISLFFFRKWF